MPLSSKELQHAMKLAALQFDKDEESTLHSWINQVIEWFQQLDKLDKDIKDISPLLADPILPPISAPPRTTLPKEAVFRNAPLVEDDLLKTDKLT